MSEVKNSNSNNEENRKKIEAEEQEGDIKDCVDDKLSSVDTTNEDENKDNTDVNGEKSKDDKDANQNESKDYKHANQDESKDDKDVERNESKDDKDVEQDESKDDNSVGDTTDYVSAAAELQQSKSPTNYDVTNESNKTYPQKRRGRLAKQIGVKISSPLNDDVSDDDQLYHEKNPEDIENAIEEDEGNRDNEKVEVRSLLPKRHVLLLMIFLGFAVVYSLRVNINVAIVAMVNNRTSITRSGRINIHVSIYIFLYKNFKSSL